MPTLRKKKDGRFFVDLYMSDGGRKVRKRISLGTTDPNEAELAYKQWCADMPAIEQQVNSKAKRNLTGGNPTLQALADWYIDVSMAARGCTDQTRHETRRRLTSMLMWFGKNNVHTIIDLEQNGHLIDKWIVEAKHLAPSTKNTHIANLRSTTKAAYESGLIDVIPIRKWPRVKEPARDYEPIALEDAREFLRILAEKHNKYADILRFLSYTGCRISDACRLKWDEIHIENGQSFAHFRQIKTGEFVAVALSQQAVKVIQSQRKSENAYVFTDRKGKELHPGHAASNLHKASKKYGFKISTKTFRQLLVSELYDAGADHALVRRITGHSSEAIQAYRRVRKSAAHDLAQKFADIFDRKTTENAQI